jgi:hypothetical protein
MKIQSSSPKVFSSAISLRSDVLLHLLPPNLTSFSEVEFKIEITDQGLKLVDWMAIGAQGGGGGGSGR